MFIIYYARTKLLLKKRSRFFHFFLQNDTIYLLSFILLVFPNYFTYNSSNTVVNFMNNKYNKNNRKMRC